MHGAKYRRAFSKGIYLNSVDFRSVLTFSEMRNTTKRNIASEVCSLTQCRFRKFILWNYRHNRMRSLWSKNACFCHSEYPYECKDHSRLSLVKMCFAYFRPDKGIAITIGVCLPTVCSLEFLEPFVNDYIHTKTSNVTMKLLGDTCQFQDGASFKNLTIIDEVTL